MALAKKKLMNPLHVLIFVEGDTDEVFFKALIDYYASVSSNKLLPYDVCNPNVRGTGDWQVQVSLPCPLWRRGFFYMQKIWGRRSDPVLTLI